MESVFTQTFSDYEYIIIDGGSTDTSKQYISSQQDKLSYWCSEKDKGIYHAMNKGIQKATGEYLLFLNSGDYLYHKETLSQIAQYLENKIDIVYADLMLTDKTERLQNHIYPDKISLEYMLLNSIGHPATFIKKELFKDSLYSEHLKIVSDWEFFFKKIILQQVSYLHVNLPVTVFNIWGISAANTPLLIEERDYVLKKLLGPMIYDQLMRNLTLEAQPLYPLFKEITASKKFQRQIKPLLSVLWKFNRFLKKFSKKKDSCYKNRKEL